jgi:aldehyde:ferredoxin oxidoreductase
MLVMLQDYRKKQYDQLTDAVYLEKGFDKNGIPTDETLKRLGFTDPYYSEIVKKARARI